jgi:adenosylhomocysteine nucleosidase
VRATLRRAVRPLRVRPSIVAFLLLVGVAPLPAADPQPILVLGALEAETRPIVAALEGGEVRDVLGLRCVAGRLAGRRAVVAATGVGKVNAAMTTSLLVERFSPVAVVFTGVAGSLDASLQPGDVVVGERLVQHDLVRHTEQGTVLREVRNPRDGTDNPVALEPSPRLLDLARRAGGEGLVLAAVAGEARSPKVAFGAIATGDSFVGSRARKEEVRERTGALAVEMEGAAVAQVCHQLGVPFLVVRGLSDRAEGDARTEARRNLGVAAGNAAAVALAVVRGLGPDRR